ncbi:hypothetical protein EMIT0P171_130022 [Pseudomonas sp. IT-P171]
MKQHAVGIDVHFVQVPLNQIQNSAHCNLLCKPRSAVPAVIPKKVSEDLGFSQLTEWVDCSSVAR